MKHSTRIVTIFAITFFSFSSLTAQTVETLIAGQSTFDDGLAIDKDGNIYASRYFGSTVTKITLSGNTSIFASGFTNPNGITFDDDGNLYVPSAKGNKIEKVTPDGTKSSFVASIANPTGLLFDPDGNLLIAQYEQNTISVRAPNGDVSIFLSANGLNGPVGLDMDEEGNLYIGNFNDGKIFKRTPAGVMTTIGDLPGWLGFLTYSNGFVYATAFQSNRIYRLKTDGTETLAYAGTGAVGTLDGDISEARFNQPNGIVASATGDTLFISDHIPRSLRMIVGVNGVSTHNEDPDELPDGYSLLQNYPNPFNPTTSINFSIPVAEQVALDVFDLNGKKVMELTDRFYSEGTHTISFDAGGLSSGVYIYKLTAGDFSQSMRMSLIK